MTKPLINGHPSKIHPSNLGTPYIRLKGGIYDIFHHKTNMNKKINYLSIYLYTYLPIYISNRK